jgi:hypothetical protein
MKVHAYYCKSDVEKGLAMAASNMDIEVYENPFLAEASDGEFCILDLPDDITADEAATTMQAVAAFLDGSLRLDGGTMLLIHSEDMRMVL